MNLLPFDETDNYRDPADQIQPIQVEPVLSVNSLALPPANETPYDAQTGWSPNILPPVTAANVEPVEYWPADPFEVSNEVTTMYEPYNDPNCQCVAYPCDCDGSQRIDPLPMPFEPVKTSPIVDPVWMPFEPAKTTTKKIDPWTMANDSILKYLGLNEPPPNVTLNIANGSAAGKAAESEPAKIFGYPWYYVAGAAAGVLLLLSSMDGKK